MRLLPVLAVAVATAAGSHIAAGPAAAQDSIRVFKVTAEGSGSVQTRQLIPGLPGLPSEINSSAAWAWKVQLPAVAFLPSGEAILTGDLAGAVKGTLSGRATQETVLRGLDGNGDVVVTRGTCTAAQQTVPVDSAAVIPGPAGEVDGEPGGHLTVTPHQHPRFAATCEGAMYPPTSQLAAEAAAGALEQRFFLPRDATRMGKVIQLVSAGPGQKDACGDLSFLDSCSLDWSGTLTFEFAGHLGAAPPPADPGVTEDDIPMPPSPAQPPAPADPSEDLFVPLPGTAKLGPGARSASVRIACAAGCSGTVSAFPAGRGRSTAAAAARRPLAVRRFTASAGEPVTVRLRFRGRARRAVRRSGAVRLVVRSGDRRRAVVAR